MPTYQYACSDADCGNRFELVQSFTDPAATTCPVCHGPVHKVYSAVGIVFKGSGFYRTDSRASNGSSGHHSTSTAKSGGSDSASSSSSSSSDSSSGANGSSTAPSSSSSSSSSSTGASASTSKAGAAT